MAYNAALNAVYNHYLAAYAPKSTTRYDAHKKSELRSIYNSIIKLNKESPLCLFDTSKKTQSFAVTLKENARQLRNTIASLGGLDEGEMLNKKTAYSSNRDLVSATFIGDIPEDGEIPVFQIEVTSLASHQMNMGHFLPSASAVSLPEDAYSFDITINDLSYEFQYNIREGETNREVQDRLARLISNADIGINADIAEDGKGNSSLRLSSSAAGLKSGQDTIFYISDDNTGKQKGSVAYLGINSIVTQPSNAEFLLNGKPESASSNHFTIDKMFELQLNDVCAPGEEVHIGLKADVDSLAENVSDLIMGYNSFIGTASGYLDSYPKSSRLVNEMTRLSRTYQNEFEQIGISFSKEGQLVLDKEALRQSALSNNTADTLSSLKGFANSVLDKLNQVSLNPMQYVEKTIVAYKNPGHNFASPYVTSAYSGMMFNSYC